MIDQRVQKIFDKYYVSGDIDHNDTAYLFSEVSRLQKQLDVTEEKLKTFQKHVQETVQVELPALAHKETPQPRIWFTDWIDNHLNVCISVDEYVKFHIDHQAKENERLKAALKELLASFTEAAGKAKALLATGRITMENSNA
jgi:hypothetical protein